MDTGNMDTNKRDHEAKENIFEKVGDAASKANDFVSEGCHNAFDSMKDAVNSAAGDVTYPGEKASQKETDTGPINSYEAIKSAFDEAGRKAAFAAHSAYETTTHAVDSAAEATAEADDKVYEGLKGAFGRFGEAISHATEAVSDMAAGLVGGAKSEPGTDAKTDEK